MNTFLIIILSILIGSYLVNLIIESLNLNHIQEDLPEGFNDFYSEAEYRKSQTYLKESTIFGLVQKSICTPLIIIFLTVGGFNYIDLLSREINSGSTIITCLIFTGFLIFGSQELSLPFAIYDTFVIEEKYGFNKPNFKTYSLDFIKGTIISILIGGPILAVIFWFFERTGNSAWLYAWTTATVFQIILMFLAPVILMPIFNKFTSLGDGELKSNIEEYARKESFQLKGVYKMDGSKRSTKSNAFFTGFGKFRRIVLFDTLIEKHPVDELVAILAHEMGHFKKKHIHKFILISVISTGLMFYILSVFMNNQNLFDAFKMENISVYASMAFFGFLYTPISLVISIVTNYLSRKYEFEADQYAAETFGKPESLINALKKLSADNLSNLAPHPLKVFLEYSHPPVLQRIKALERFN